MQLPGGLVEDGTRRRDWAFHPVSGALEVAVAEVAETAETVPEAVTRALTLALQRVAGDAPTEARVASLCVGDRQFLMRELEGHLGSRGGWFQSACRQCGEPFDFHLDYADLPVQEAGPCFPEVRIEFEGRRWRFRLPTGADQEGLLEQPDTEAGSWLLGRLALDGELPSKYGSELAAAAEAALEAMAPGVVLNAQAVCPSCGTGNEVELDPYEALSRRIDDLLQEVHQIALHYHWGERDILDLPRERRKRYLRLIDRARGMNE